MIRMGRPAHLALAALLGVGLLLAGCVNIPAQGPVVGARRVEGGAGGLIQQFPDGPLPDVGPVEFIRGFLNASSTFTNDHEVARSFLDQGARVSWHPASRVVVYSREGLSITVRRAGITAVDLGGSSAPRRPSTSPGAAASASVSARRAQPSQQAVLTAPPQVNERVQVRIQVPVEGRIDTSGQYTMAFHGDVETRTFDLVGTGQGWRIAALQQGILVTSYDFGITFRGIPVYFADPTGAYLVPDIRWFPVSGTMSTPSQLLSALLAGPAAWLAPAVVTGVPPQTLPTVNSVRIVDGVATVDLTKEAREADARKRLILKAQLERTLAGLPYDTPVTSVVVTVEQQRFELQPSAGPAPGRDNGDRGGLLSPPQVDIRPVVLDSRGAIARLVGRAVQPVPGLGALAVPGAVSPATDAAGQAYAVLAANRSRLLYAVPSGPVTVLMAGHALVAPSFDPFGWVWSVEEEAGTEVLAGRPEAGVARVHASCLAGLRVRSLRISREGARALIVADRPGTGSTVLVVGIIRNDQGVPKALTAPLPLLVDAVDATAGAWVDATHVVVVAHRPGSVAMMPWVVEVGGGVKETSPTPAVTITAGNSDSDLYVQLANGTVRSRIGSSWSDLPGVHWPAMPG